VEASLGAGPTPAQVSVNGGETAPFHLPLPYAGIQLMGISPDGSELLMQGFNASEVEVPEWIVPVTGGSPRRLDDLMVHDAAWSPDKRLVAFAASDSLFLLDSNNEKRKIFTASGIVLWPRWSPDGERLRFTVEDSSTASSALWEIRADGRGAHLLLPGWNKPSIECCGEWSRDGRYYVFQTGTFAHSPANSTNRRTAQFLVAFAFARWQMALCCRCSIPVRNDSARSFIWPDLHAYFHALP
jgi:hypothetical protein